MSEVQDILKQLDDPKVRAQFSQEELDDLYILADPIRWAETYLRDPENPKKPLILRWYQKEMLSCQDKKKVYRCGRQIGKTIDLCVEQLWFGFTNSYKKILLVCPYKSQVDVVWTQINRLVADSEVLKKSIKRIRNNPHTIEFNNGSIIRGFTAGSKAGNKASSVRGQSAHLIVLDEMDYMGEEAINAVQAILTSDPDTRVVASSTPSGRREQFYKWCTDKRLGWTQFYFPSSVGPHWISMEEAEQKGIPMHDCLEYYFRSTCTETEYLHEYEAEFGEEVEGVFSGDHLDACLADYRYTDWREPIYKKGTDDVDRWVERRGSLKYYEPHNIYIMGVDWNRPENGVHLVVLEYMVHPPTDVPHEAWWSECKNMWRVFWREEINVKEMTQHHAVSRIVYMNKLLNLNAIYVDEGYGDVQIEMLRKRSVDSSDPRTRKLLERVKPINAASTIEIRDPATNRKIKKPVKPFIINNAVRCIENRVIIIPEMEDNQHQLAAQLREFRVKKRSPEGRPIYEGEDHILDAFCLALYGYTAEFTDLMKPEYATSVRILDNILQSHLKESGIENRWDGGDAVQKVSDVPLGTFASPTTPSLEEIVAKELPGTEYIYTTDSRAKRMEKAERQDADRAKRGYTHQRGHRTVGFMRTRARLGSSFGKRGTGRRSTF